MKNVLVLVLMLAAFNVVFAISSASKWPSSEVANKNNTDMYKVTATSTMQTLTLTSKSKAIAIKNWGTSDVMIHPEGGTVTASTGGMPVASKGNSGDFYGNDLTTQAISYISMTAGSAILFVEVDY